MYDSHYTYAVVYAVHMTPCLVPKSCTVFCDVLYVHIVILSLTE